MENNQDKETFSFTYSAKEQEEIKKIRQKYQTTEESEMVRLRKLDEKVTQKATSIAIAYGVAGALILGTGMSLVMTDLGMILNISIMLSMVLGIGAGLIGLVLSALAYPMYNRTLKKEREKIAPEILKLTEELLH